MLGKFIGREIEVDAEQWLPGKTIHGVFRAHRFALIGSVDTGGVQYDRCYEIPAIHTEGGVHLLVPGEWIVRSIDGRIAVLSDRAFRDTFRSESGAPVAGAPLIDMIQSLADNRCCLGAPCLVSEMGTIYAPVHRYHVADGQIVVGRVVDWMVIGHVPESVDEAGAEESTPEPTTTS